MTEQAYAFRLDGKPISCDRYGNGHINETYLLTDSTGRDYILQKINRFVFRDLNTLMRNIVAVTNHLKKTANSRRESLTLVPTKDGADWHVDKDGESWRLVFFTSAV